MDTIAFLRITDDASGAATGGKSRPVADSGQPDDEADFAAAVTDEGETAKMPTASEVSVPQPPADIEMSEIEPADEETEEAPVPAPLDSGSDALASILETWSGVSATIGDEETEAHESVAGQAKPDNRMSLGIPVTVEEVDADDTGSVVALDAADEAEANAKAPSTAETVSGTDRIESADADSDAPIRREAPATNNLASTVLKSADPVISDLVPTLPSQAEASRAALPAADWRPVPVTPQAVIRQVSEAVVTAKDDRIEIALSPEELGRVRLVVTGAERTPHVTIWIERPEVMDLIRRNAGLLMQHFGEAGLDGAELEFREERQDRDGNPHWSGLSGIDEVNSPDITGLASASSVALASAALGGDRRIDLRL